MHEMSAEQTREAPSLVDRLKLFFEAASKDDSAPLHQVDVQLLAADEATGVDVESEEDASEDRVGVEMIVHAGVMDVPESADLATENEEALKERGITLVDVAPDAVAPPLPEKRPLVEEIDRN